LFDGLLGPARRGVAPGGGEGSTEAGANDCLPPARGACLLGGPSVAAAALSVATARILPAFFCSTSLPSFIDWRCSKTHSAGYYHTFASAFTLF